MYLCNGLCMLMQKPWPGLILCGKLPHIKSAIFRHPIPGRFPRIPPSIRRVDRTVGALWATNRSRTDGNCYLAAATSHPPASPHHSEPHSTSQSWCRRSLLLLRIRQFTTTVCIHRLSPNIGLARLPAARSPLVQQALQIHQLPLYCSYNDPQSITY